MTVVNWKNDMELHRKFFRLMLLAPVALASYSAEASGVVTCDYCVDPKNTAINSGAGLTIILDYDQRKILGYEVEYDRELKKYRAISQAIPASINSSFQTLINSTPGTISSTPGTLPTSKELSQS